jgi:hypothetical protein
MRKFTLCPNSEKVILHNLAPEMTIQVIINDEEEYDEYDDVFEAFEFMGNRIVVKWCADKNVISQFENYNLIRSILRRAWRWYRSQVYIEKKEFVPGAMEDKRHCNLFN